MSAEDAELEELVASGSIQPQEREKQKKEAAATAELYISRARNVTWQMPGHPSRCVLIHESKDVYEIFSTLEFCSEQDMLHLAPEGYHREVFVNLSAIDYIAAPAHKFRQGELQLAAQELGEVE